LPTVVARFALDLALPRARLVLARFRVEPPLLRFELLLAEAPLRLVAPPVERDPLDPLLREPDAVLA
jgi:hypothetical protein